MKERSIEEEEGLTRRGFLKGAVFAGIAGFLGATVYGTIDSLVGKEFRILGEVNNAFLYTRPRRAKLPIWYEDLIGQTARVDHFEPGQGASTVWKRVTDEEGRNVFPGFPTLLIRMGHEIDEFPAAYRRDVFLVDDIFAIFNCCTHACCAPGWQLVPPGDVKSYPGYDTVYCECHFSQYDPRRVGVYRHPPPPEASGAEYLGVFKIPGLGPADRGMPLIPLQREGNTLIGIATEEEWYRYLAWRSAVIPQEE